MPELRGFAVLVVLAVGLVAGLSAGAAAQEAGPLVVIDAGHGGVDPGARGAAGTLEKDVALRVARELARTLRATGRYQVRLTRDADVLIPLHERTRLANEWREEREADLPALFVSVHTNAHDRSTVRGFETYFLSEALTEDARRVAELENAAQRFEISSGSEDPLSFILTDLRQNLYLRESSEVAALVQGRLGRFHPGPDRGVKQAGFVVLSGAFMPALLVELGFVTNRQDEAMLTAPDFGSRAATELAAAIDKYFARQLARETAPAP